MQRLDCIGLLADEVVPADALPAADEGLPAAEFRTAAVTLPVAATPGSDDTGTVGGGAAGASCGQVAALDGGAVPPTVSADHDTAVAAGLPAGQAAPATNQAAASAGSAEMVEGQPPALLSEQALPTVAQTVLASIGTRVSTRSKRKRAPVNLS